MAISVPEFRLFRSTPARTPPPLNILSRTGFVLTCDLQRASVSLSPSSSREVSVRPVSAACFLASARRCSSRRIVVRMRRRAHNELCQSGKSESRLSLFAQTTLQPRSRFPRTIHAGSSAAWHKQSLYFPHTQETAYTPLPTDYRFVCPTSILSFARPVPAPQHAVRPFSFHEPRTVQIRLKPLARRVSVGVVALLGSDHSIQ